jgi:hypothetical protein
VTGEALADAQAAFVMRVLNVFAMWPNDCNDSLMWRTDGEYAPITFMVNCSDEFDWATADAEVITPDDIGDLEQAFTDVRDATDGDLMYEAPLLYAARRRKQRPQGAAYPKYPKLAGLFDACGPERAVTLDNPHPRPDVTP